MTTKSSRHRTDAPSRGKASDEQAVNGQAANREAHPLPQNWRDLVIPDPHRPGPDRVRLADHGIAVWAIISHLKALGDETTPDTIAQAAVDFRVPEVAIIIAVAYYSEHRAAIDTRLAINAAAAA
ncbi:MAG TPA: hypothetical protein VFL82_05735 [Thermomicrobiales bacterium]|nr:hypothetical protein [Thermomicrobiales bacterium]